MVSRSRKGRTSDVCPVIGRNRIAGRRMRQVTALRAWIAVLHRNEQLQRALFIGKQIITSKKENYRTQEPCLYSFPYQNDCRLLYLKNSAKLRCCNGIYKQSGMETVVLLRVRLSFLIAENFGMDVFGVVNRLPAHGDCLR